jgi:hypothetical protein
VSDSDPTIDRLINSLANRSVSDPTLINSIEGKSPASRSNLTCPQLTSFYNL